MPILSEGPQTKTRRYDHCLTWAYGDSVVLIGGYYDYEGHNILPTVEMYDGNMNFYKNLPNMTTPRRSHSCTYVDTRIIVQGGWNGSDYLDSVEVLDLASGDGWVLWKPLPWKSSNQAMTTVFGRIFSFGGRHPKQSKTLMEISVLNKREKVFQSYEIHKHPKFRENGHKLVPVFLDDICPL